MGVLRLGLASVAGIALLATSSCAPYRPRLSFAVEQRILRETTLDDLPEDGAELGDGVVRLVRFGHSAGACSGALIGPRHVLTAQHCVVALDGHGELTLRELPAGDMHVELGGGYLPWGRVGVREVHACEGYAGDLEHDLAVVVLAKAVPANVHVYDVSFDVPREAAVYQLAGFGTRKKPRSVPGWGAAISVNRHFHSGPIHAWNDSRVVVDVPGAPGDSGGPIVDLETGRIVSVVSQGRTEEAEAEDGPLVTGPRLTTCKKTISVALAR